MKNIIRTSLMLVCALAATVSANALPPAAGVFKTNCAPCHGVTGDANTAAGKAFKVPSFSSDDVVKESDSALFDIARNGKGKMPAWHDKLSDDQLKDLVSYIRSLQKKP